MTTQVISIEGKVSFFQKILFKNLNLEPFAKEILQYVAKISGAKSGQLFLYDTESSHLKKFAELGKPCAQAMPMPELGKVLIKDHQMVMPLCYEKSLVGVLTCKDISETVIKENIDELLECSIVGGNKLFSLIQLETLNRKMRVINEHFLTFEVSNEGTISDISTALLNELGYLKEEVVGRTPESLFPLKQKIEGKAPTSNQTNEIEISTKTGHKIWVTSQGIPLKNFLGSQHGKLIFQQNITKQKQIELLTIKDDLTDLFNRRFFHQIFPKEIETVRRSNALLTFMMVDIDNFKKYNDTYGHQEGDRVLKLVSKTMSACFKRTGDYVFRLGGEEFGVLAVIKEGKDSETLGNLMRQNIQKLAIKHSGNLPNKVVTISVGIVNIHKEDLHDMDDFYKLADVALYEAKEQGRNRVVLSGEVDDIELF